MSYLGYIKNGQKKKLNSSSFSSNIVSGTLLSGQTTVVLTSEKITTDSMIDVYTTVYGLNPTDVTVTTGSITLTFEAQSSDVGVKVKVG